MKKNALIIADMIISILIIISVVLIVNGHEFTGAAEGVFHFDFSYFLLAFTAVMGFAKLAIKKYIYNATQQEDMSKDKNETGKRMEKIDALSKMLDAAVIITALLLNVIWKLL